MKILILLSLLLLTVYSANTSNDISPKFSPILINVAIRQLFEKIRGVILNGDTESNIPILDPYKFEHTHFNLQDILSFSVDIMNGVFSGLGNFELQESNFVKNETSIQLKIIFPSFIFKSDYYEMQGNLYEVIPITGQGQAHIEVHNFSVYSNIYLKQSSAGKSVLIDRFENPNFSIQNIKSRIEFDKNIDDVLNAMVDELLAEYLTRFNKIIAVKYTDKLKLTLNPILNGFDTWKYIASLT